MKQFSKRELLHVAAVDVLAINARDEISFAAFLLGIELSKRWPELTTEILAVNDEMQEDDLVHYRMHRDDVFNAIGSLLNAYQVD